MGMVAGWTQNKRVVGGGREREKKGMRETKERMKMAELEERPANTTPFGPRNVEK